MIDVTKEAAERELRKAARKAKRMFTRKRFRKPSEKDRPYVTPIWSIGSVCRFCGRPCSFYGTRCRECFQKQLRAKYETKTRAENDRVNANEAVFYNVTKGVNMKAKEKKLPITPITRSTTGLRTALFEEMEALRNGTSNAQRARSVAMMANSILQSVQVEIEYHKYVSANKGRIDGENKVVALGTDISLAA